MAEAQGHPEVKAGSPGAAEGDLEAAVPCLWAAVYHPEAAEYRVD